MALQVRACTYRGVKGWCISGRPKDSAFPLSIFFEHESAARREVVKLRQDPRAEIDWSPELPATR